MGVNINLTIRIDKKQPLKGFFFHILMKNWSETYHQKLEQVRKQISPSDFRFYNLSHLPLIAKKSEEQSLHCTQCKANLQSLEELAGMLPDCFQNPEKRKVFEKEKSRIEIHLQTSHKISYTNYHYSLYTFAGLIAGLSIGLVFSLIILNVINLNYLLISGILGVLAGQILGKTIERKKYHRNQQV